MQDFADIENRFNALLYALSPQSRLKLMRKIGQDIAKSNRERITQQQNLDGSPYTPRKKKLQKKTGRIKKQKLFRKIKTAKFLKRKATAESVTVGFYGRTARLAEIHQTGGWDTLKGKRIKMPKREILGVTEKEREIVEREILEALNAN